MLIRLSRTQSKGEQLPRLIRTMLKAFGLMLALAGVISIANEFKTDKRKMHVEGKIYSFREAGEGFSKKYYPSVEFWIHEGQVVHFQGPASSTKPEVGTKVPVVFDPLKPEYPEIDTFSRRWMFSSIAISMGFAMLIGGMFWRDKKAIG